MTTPKNHSEREKMYKEALGMAFQGDVTTTATPVIFTSCRRAAAEAFVKSHDGYALIHHTPAGARLEDLCLFEHMPQSLACLHWLLLSARFVNENRFARETVFIGDPANPSSTAFGLEIPMLYHAQPHVRALADPLSGRVVDRDRWLSENLMRPYVIAMVNRWMHGPQDELDQAQTVLMRKFGEKANGLPATEDHDECAAEIGMRLILAGYLHEHGRFPVLNRPGFLHLCA